MSTLVRIVVASIISIFVTSCNFDINLGPGIDGDGNVVVKERRISDDFDKIKVSRGIDVILTQSDDLSLKVEADENLHEIITTEIDNGVLRISTNENIKYSDAKKVLLSVKDLSEISTTSGSSVSSKNTFTTEKLIISSTSGSHVDLGIKTAYLRCDSTSGAGIILSGKTEDLKVSATSGSYIRAGDLRAQSTQVSATSGANISVNTEKELTANASSGGSIRYSGDPEKVSKSDGVSGSIRKN
ncbi:MAG: DUF2807 domain-containing protein [Winogradskyella sp.]|uniref:head GIN domain-containing protein n=1 Tax=Winogradskyella sp. TaxID=1883156 RepID=UPI000F3F10B9|nr:head GIN domain-containing protein [Winogradskyella sp.]RNC84834.1 MAG: DUF2807 domain-containing protein [Winogradskyella sp.]